MRSLELRCNVQAKAHADGWGIWLIGKAHKRTDTRQHLAGLRPGHDVDVTVKFLA